MRIIIIGDNNSKNAPNHKHNEAILFFTSLALTLSSLTTKVYAPEKLGFSTSQDY